MSVKSLLEASYSKQKHHRSFYDAKVLSRQTMRAQSHAACRNARRDPEGDWFAYLERRRGMVRSTTFHRYRSSWRSDLVTKFFISRVGKHVDDVMKELRAKLGYSDMAHMFWCEMRDSFGFRDYCFSKKKSVDYHNVRIELDDHGILTRVDLLESQPVREEKHFPTRDEISNWIRYGHPDYDQPNAQKFSHLYGSVKNKELMRGWYRHIKEEKGELFWTYPTSLIDRTDGVVPFSSTDRGFWNLIQKYRQDDLIHCGYCSY